MFAIMKHAQLAVLTSITVEAAILCMLHHSCDIRLQEPSALTF